MIVESVGFCAERTRVINPRLLLAFVICGLYFLLALFFFGQNLAAHVIPTHMQRSLLLYIIAALTYCYREITET